MTALYQIYGQQLATDFPFKTKLLPGSGTPDLTFSLVHSFSDYQDWRRVEPAISSRDFIYLHCCEAYHVFHFIDLAEFYIFPDKIICYLLDQLHDYQVEVIFLGLVFAYWLELRGMRALHASAVCFKKQGVAFLSTNAGGKTSLAAALLRQGYPLLTDDILTIQYIENQFIGYPGFPQMRMWPEVAEHFLGGYEELALAHPAYDKRRVPVSSLGDFSMGAVPLKFILLPERRQVKEPGIKLEAVPPVEALTRLTACSFAAHYVEAAGLEAERFRFFSALLQNVPAYRLIYPSGLPRLLKVGQELITTLDQLLTN